MESKRAGVPLSTVLNNGPVCPEAAQPVPVHSSFDGDGRFIDLNHPLAVDSARLPTSTTAASIPSQPNISAVLDPVASVSAPAPAAAAAVSAALIIDEDTLSGVVDELIALECTLPYREVAVQCMAEESIRLALHENLINSVVRSELAIVSFALSHTSTVFC